MFCSLALAMIADDAHSQHGIVLLLVLKVRKACPFSILPCLLDVSSTLLEKLDSAGVVVDDNAKGQLVSAVGSPLHKLHIRASCSFRDLVLLPRFGFPCLCVSQLLMRKVRHASFLAFRIVNILDKLYKCKYLSWDRITQPVTVSYVRATSTE